MNIKLDEIDKEKLKYALFAVVAGIAYVHAQIRKKIIDDYLDDADEDEDENTSSA